MKNFQNRLIKFVLGTCNSENHVVIRMIQQWAMQAGKHVSVEKPCCHNIYEGRKLVEAAEKYPVIVQDGAEQRSNPCAESMADFLHDGKLGEVYMAKGICYKRRNTIGRTPDEPIPPGVDYDLLMVTIGSFSAFISTTFL